MHIRYPHTNKVYEDSIRIFLNQLLRYKSVLTETTFEWKVLAFGSDLCLCIIECKLYGARVWNRSGRISTHISAIYYLLTRCGWYSG